MADRDGTLFDGDQLLYAIVKHRKAERRLRGGVVGTLMTTGPMTFQVKVTLPVLWLSLADAVTVYGLLLAAVLSIVPEITPVVVLILRPGGRPLAL